MTDIVQFDSQHSRNRRPSRRRALPKTQASSLILICALVAVIWSLAYLGAKSEQLRAFIDSRSAWVERAMVPEFGQAARVPTSPIDVIDGDTVRTGGQTYRLVGFNTPESGGNAKCRNESELAARATARLKELIAEESAELEQVPCACRAGTEGTTACNYGRLCGTLRVGSKDVGTLLIAEGLAESYVCGTTSCPPRKNWCAG